MKSELLVKLVKAQIFNIIKNNTNITCFLMKEHSKI